MNNPLALTVRPDDLEDLLECLWHLLWQAAQPLAHPGVRIPLVARLYEEAILLAGSAHAAADDLAASRLWNLAQHHRRRLDRWRETMWEIYEEHAVP